MILHFELQTDPSPSAISVDIKEFVIAGWAGRDRHAIEHHIEELAAIGVPRPSRVPLFYRVDCHQLTQDARIQVVGNGSSGEVETFVFMHEGELCVSLTSDHTDRKLETVSVALSKQVCAKPVGRVAWRFADLAAHWDELEIHSTITEDGKTVVYQKGSVALLQHPLDLIAAYTDGKGLPPHCAMSCGTVATIGQIRPASVFEMSLHDLRHQRVLRHRYDVDFLPEVA